MLQGLAGFVLGAIVTVVLFSYRPQLLDQIRYEASAVSHDWNEGRNDGRSSGYAGEAPASDIARNDDSASDQTSTDSGPGEHDIAVNFSRRFGLDSGYTDRTSWRPSDARGDDRIGLCQAEIEIDNRSDRAMAVSLVVRHRGHDIAMEGGSDPISLPPGARIDRFLRDEDLRYARDVQAACERLNRPGALTVEARACVLDDHGATGKCRRVEIDAANDNSWSSDNAASHRGYAPN